MIVATYLFIALYLAMGVLVARNSYLELERENLYLHWMAYAVIALLWPPYLIMALLMWLIYDAGMDVLSGGLRRVLRRCWPWT